MALFSLVRSVLYFTLRLQILIKTYCSWYLALRSNCIPGYWKLSSSPCSAVNIELFTTNIPLNALEFSVSTFLIQWKHEWNNMKTEMVNGLSVGSGIYFNPHLCTVGSQMEKICPPCHAVIALKRSKSMWYLSCVVAVYNFTFLKWFKMQSSCCQYRVKLKCICLLNAAPSLELG